MADDLRDAADLVIVNDLALDEALKNDLRQAAPFLAAIPAVEATNGDVHKYLKRTGAPTVGFRAINVGRDVSPSAQEVVTIALKYLDASFHLDVAYCTAFSSPVYGTGVNAAINSELGEHLAAAMFEYEKQLINGTGNQAGGFDGLADNLGSLGTMVKSGGGSTASSQTSVYLVRAGENDVRSVVGNEGRFNMSDQSLAVVDDGAGSTFDAYRTAAGGWMGMEHGSIWSTGRIGNIETALSDDDIYGLAKEFPANRPPNLCVMSPKALELLRKSRTATNPTGQPAPWANAVLNDVPVIVTDAITETEAVLT
jgi:hypothetical protein